MMAPLIPLKARSLKCTIVLDSAELATVRLREGIDRYALRVATAARIITLEVNARSLRRALAAITEHGTDAVAVILEERLGAWDVLLDADPAMRPRVPKAAEPEAAAA